MAATGLYGKHPGFGDFIAHGLPAPAQAAIEAWLTQVMPPLRDTLGERWEPVWDSAPDIRFWFGPAVAGAGWEAPLAGVIRPWRDKVGRRFPLVCAVTGADMPPPVSDGDQAAYEALSAALDASATGVAELTAAGLADTLASALPDLPAPTDVQAPGQPLWAANPDPDPARLCPALAGAELRQMAQGRAYAWCAGDGSRASAIHAGAALPGVEVLRWLLEGLPVAAEPEASDRAPALAGAEGEAADEE